MREGARHWCLGVGQSILGSEDKQKFEQGLSRIMSQTEEHLGLFYLHPDGEVVTVRSVALLRAQFAPPVGCYEDLLMRRTGGLRPEFQSRLGWLTGNLFSRPATQDWTESSQRKDAVKDVQTEECAKFEWRPKKKIKKLTGAQKALSDKEILEIIDKLGAEKPLDVAVEAVRSTYEGLEQNQQLSAAELVQRLKTNAKFTGSIKAD
ncbi:MAG: hypothetical protein U0R49_04085 [Fimbriimonadales bacterium]